MGSNLGDREAALRNAWKRIESFCGRTRLSRIYETRPLYVEDQPRYLNAVGEAWSVLGPEDMLAELQRIESDFGRDRAREIRRGPRTLDLDILLCGDRVVETGSLSIPHPLMAERLFVLVPLLELDPALRDPRSGQPLSAARAALEKASGGDGGVYLHPGAGYTGPSQEEA